MAVPKRRHSRTRGKKRRTHWKLAQPAVNVCGHCNSPKRPHRICTNCGYYDGEEIVEPRETA
jgi:large subunit ribosomal protein L32